MTTKQTKWLLRSLSIAGLLCLVLLLACCGENPERSRTALVNSGYTNITTTGWEFNECGQDDAYSTGFRATNSAGLEVTGVVCCGLFKGCTVRF